MREFPSPDSSTDDKALYYTLSGVAWLACVLLLIFAFNSTDTVVLKLILAILCAVGGSKFYTAAGQADENAAKRAATIATEFEQEVRAKKAVIARRNAEVEAILAADMAQVRNQTEVKRLETEQAEFQLQQDLIAVGRQKGITANDVSEVNKTKYLSDISVEQKRAFNQADLDNDVAKMREQVRLAIVAKHFSEHQMISLLGEQLDTLYLQVEEISKGTLPEGAKRRMISDREEYISTLKEDQRGRQQRLLEAHNRGNLRGDNETPLLRGNFEASMEGDSN